MSASPLNLRCSRERTDRRKRRASGLNGARDGRPRGNARRQPLAETQLSSVAGKTHVFPFYDESCFVVDATAPNVGKTDRRALPDRNVTRTDGTQYCRPATPAVLFILLADENGNAALFLIRSNFVRCDLGATSCLCAAWYPLDVDRYCPEAPLAN